jgi:hypothetical protein
MDGINRDKPTEAKIKTFRETPKGSLPYFDALWNTWLILKRKDVKMLPKETFTLVRGNLYLAGLHFNVMHEEKPLYEYVVWFMDNRIKNTGHGGYAKCEMSEIYTPLKANKKPKQKVPKPNTINAE